MGARLRRRIPPPEASAASLPAPSSSRGDAACRQPLCNQRSTSGATAEPGTGSSEMRLLFRSRRTAEQQLFGQVVIVQRDAGFIQTAAQQIQPPWCCPSAARLDPLQQPLARSHRLAKGIASGIENRAWSRPKSANRALRLAPSSPAPWWRSPQRRSGAWAASGSGVLVVISS